MSTGTLDMIEPEASPDEFGDDGPVQLTEAFWSFKPRPDQPERYDQQTSFINSRLPGVAFLIGGNGGGTTECAVAKACDFMLQQQQPPREDTPFWVIAESYEQVCNAIWKEKMYGHGHIPSSEVDWERVRWYKPKQNWPYEIPLKPWVGKPGRNWSIKFKSYGQGREQMQAESIGGFLFSEQFPWDILTEVVRGCREYKFRGAKSCEFTPIDAAKSMALEEHIEQDTLPPGWQIFRANTECAMEAGHVSKEWFDEFFGLVPDDMKLVRMIGAFASFEGAIYPQFNPAIHFLPPDWEPEVGYQHRRAIDWGFGPDNAFCCLWGCRDNVGCWTIYDEYYSTNQAYTIHDHLKAIADKWAWPFPNNWYGCTYADPSEPGNLRLASRFSEYHPTHPDFDIQGASNSVLEGIEHVKWLLQFDKALGKPRLRIVKANCPNLAREIRTYRWEMPNNKGLNPHSARPIPLKKNDHACFPAGSLVDTPSGSRPIETIKAGDVVLTHRGACRVNVGSVNLGEREILEITFADGRRIMCTAEHPLAKSGGGWVAAGESLGHFIDVSSCKFANQKPNLETGSISSSMADSHGDDTPTPLTRPCVATIGEASEREAARCCTIGCISKYTSIPAVQSRSDMLSITSTKTTTTTPRKTCSYRRRLSILSTIELTSRRPESLLRSGTNQPPDGNGTSSTEKMCFKTEHRSLSDANIAKKISQPRIVEKRRDTVPGNVASMPGKSEETTTPNESALSAKNHSLSTATQRRKLARRNVQPLAVVRVKRNIGQVDVFNLSTADGTYFVNGVLVSNCDSLRYMVYSEANKQGIVPEAKRRERNHGRYGIQIDQRAKR